MFFTMFSLATQTSAAQTVLLPRNAVWQYVAGVAGWKDDAFGRYRHPAMSGGENRILAGIQGESYAGLQGTAMLSMACSGAAGSGLLGFGLDHRSFLGAGESRVSLGYALPISRRLRVGLRMGYYQLRVPGHSSEISIPVEWGVSYRQERISIGFAAIQSIQPGATSDHPSTPAIFRISTVWSLSEGAGLAFDVVREDGWGLSGRPMVWYRPVGGLRILGGMVVDEGSAFLGVSYKMIPLGVDLFFERHARMGWIGAVGFVCQIKGGKQP